MQSYNITYVIVSFNSDPYLEKSIVSAIKFSRKNDRIFIIDNNSQDKSREIISRLQSSNERIESVFLDKNVGFGAGNNVALKKINSNWFFLLNSDAWLVDDSVSMAVDIINKESNIAIAGIPLVFPNNKPQTYAYPFSSSRKWLLQLLKGREIVSFLCKVNIIKNLLLRLDIARNFILSQTENPHTDGSIRTVDWVCGASMLISGEFIKNFGGFDEKIFLYGEDEDICILAHQKDKKVVTVSVPPIVHVFGWGKNSFNQTVAELKYKSLKYFLIKHSSSILKRNLRLIILPLHVFGFMKSIKFLLKIKL